MKPSRVCSTFLLAVVAGCQSEGNPSSPGPLDATTELRTTDDGGATVRPDASSGVRLVLALDLDPGGSPKSTSYPKDNWDRATRFVAAAEKYKMKVSLYTTAQWGLYVQMDTSGARAAQFRTWETNGHEIAVHHHSPRHPLWDGYVNDPTSYKTNAKYTGRDVTALMTYVNPLTALNGGKVLGGGMTDDNYDESINPDGSHDYDGQKLRYRRIGFSSTKFNRPISGCSYLTRHNADGSASTGTVTESGIEGADSTYDSWQYYVALGATLGSTDPSSSWDAVKADIDACIRGAASGDYVAFGVHPEEYNESDGRAVVWDSILSTVLSNRSDGIRVQVVTSKTLLGLP